MSFQRARRRATLFVLLSLVATLLPVQQLSVLANHTPAPTTVTIAGDLQSEAGCSGDWQPECAATYLAYDGNDDVWQGTETLPAGSYQYKAALNNGWAENYGKNAAFDGANIPLNASGGGSVKFYYDHKSHWVTDNRGSVIATVPGSFQSELGCSGDWDPSCLRSWLQDTDGDGTYSFQTTAIPAGSYLAKVAINESWDVNYGQGGAQNGADIPFNVPANNSNVAFSYDAASHVLTITVTAPPPVDGSDNNVEWDGLRHDSRDSLYRTPGGAVPAGTPVTLRFRTFHDDVTAVGLRVYDLNANGQAILPMSLAATGVSCYQPGLEAETCDYWAVTLPNTQANNLWYRFIVTDGTDTDYYGDNTSALDGGLGATTDDVVDQSYALMVYTSSFAAPSWAKDAVIYQIFPDRFRNGRSNNDPQTGDVRYDEPVIKLPWGTLPEGYCRNYADGNTNCPWRFDNTPPASSPTKEQPTGRDYMGGDLKGIDQSLDYLKSIGVTAIYMNPIFDAGSNHSYDTQDYYKIDPYFGTQKDWENLNKHADQLGIKLIVDGVFNHMSSDSPFFDRYHHYPTVGACESVSSPYRDWFVFRNEAGGPCAGPGGPNTMAYEGWFGFDSIPVLNKSNPAVQNYFIDASNPNNVSQYWLRQGAEAWRLDVMGDASFPNGYWEEFRQTVKSTDPNALIIGELWQKDSTLLRYLRGDRADTTMNYRLRDAVLGLLAPGNFDSKGFGDSGRIIEPSEFASRVLSIREDYSDAAYYSLMNLMDSHDTERLLWTLTPGQETRAEKEQNAANVAAGKQRQQLASLIQYTMPGAPTVYYGDEIAMTGDDDPDDRRTFPWVNDAPGGDAAMKAHYTTLSQVRKASGALTSGDISVLLANDADDTLAYARKTGSQAAIVAINRSDQQRTLTIPVGGFVPDGTGFTSAYGVGNASGGSYTASAGVLQVVLNPMSGQLLQTASNLDLTPAAAPTGLRVTDEGSGEVSLAWNSVPGAASYNVYRSPLTGGGYVLVDNVTGTSLTDTGLENARTYYYVARSLDGAGNESGASNEVSALPHHTIGWANLQWPPSMAHTVSVTDRTDEAYGQVWIDGVTQQPGATEGLLAQLGFGPQNTDASGSGWTWVDATFNTNVGNNDEFKASLLPEQVGTYHYLYRYSTTDGRDWLYADQNGPTSPTGYTNPGALTVNSSGDTTAPAVPTGLRVESASPAGVELAWNAVSGDLSLYGYEVLRGTAAGGPYTLLARVTGTGYDDTAVASSTTYYYVVRSLDNSFNRSANSAEVSATAELRTVTLTFNVTVPATTDATGRSVYIAGYLDRLDGGLPQWNPGGVVLTRVDATHWTITLTGKETTQIAYKYALGSWDFVEKDGSCGEIADRQLTLSYGANGTQVVNDTVPNWRNVTPCGN